MDTLVTVSVGAMGLAQALGTVIEFAAVVTVPPAVSARPTMLAELPIVKPAAPMMVPTKLEFAPSVVALTGAQNTSVEQAPAANDTLELTAVPRAPPGRKIYTPDPESVTVEPTLIAPVLE